MKHVAPFKRPYLRALGFGLALVTAIGSADANRPNTTQKSTAGDGVATRPLTREVPWGRSGTKRQSLTTKRVKMATGTIKVSSFTQEYVPPESGKVALRRSVERTRGADGGTTKVDVEERLDGTYQTKTVEILETPASGLVRREISTVDLAKDSSDALPLVHIVPPKGALRPLDAIVHFARTDKRMLARAAKYEGKPQSAEARRFWAVIGVLGGATIKPSWSSTPFPLETTVGFRLGESPRTMAMRIASHQWGMLFERQFRTVAWTPRNFAVAIRDSVSAFFMAP